MTALAPSHRTISPVMSWSRTLTLSPVFNITSFLSDTPCVRLLCACQ
jgi:hypothetical protein